MSNAASAQPDLTMARQLLLLANQARAHAGAPPLTWDDMLAAAAMKHCQRMAVEGALSHRYPGELDLTERAAQTGAHFSLVEENIALAQSVEQLHDGWMHSPMHRENMLNPKVDRVGIAVIARDGDLYAVQDFSAGVASLTPQRAESHIASLLATSGISVRNDVGEDARRACALDHGLPPKLAGGMPMFVMRWQGADLSHLPQQLVDRLGSGRYRQAAVGSCEPIDGGDGFTMYRFAVLLY